MLRSFASRTLRVPPVSETVPWKSLPARGRVTSAVPALTIVAPATKASALWVTATLLVVTFRLAAALPTPLAPMAPSCVATLLTIVTAPVPVELMAPAIWLPAVFSVTAPLPAAAVVVPVTCSTLPPLCVMALLVVPNDRLPVAVTLLARVRPPLPTRVTF